MSWTINNVIVNNLGCADVGMIINWNVCGGSLYGGWDDLQLDFQVTSEILTNSEFTFTMYYQLVPVTPL